MDDNFNEEIKSMKLYLRPDRIYDELKELGYGRDSPLKVEDVSKFDSWHYHGTAACDEAIQRLGIQSHHRVLDVGSGVGGAPRYLSHRTGCHVTGVELQSDVCDIARDLTKRCGLDDKVKFITGDFLEMNQDELGSFDFVVSWLVFLHIPDRKRLYAKCAACLKPGGKVDLKRTARFEYSQSDLMRWVEDFYKKEEFSATEMSYLKEGLYCEYLPTRTEFEAGMSEVGFSVKFVDLSESYAQFVRQRAEQHFTAEQRERKTRIYGAETYESLGSFFKIVESLLNGAHMGGARVICEKP